jgi:hypothetical protein
MRLLGKRLIKGIFQPKTDEVTGAWRKILSENISRIT